MFSRSGVKAFLLTLFSTVVLVVSAVAQGKSAEEFYRLPQDAVDALSNGTEFVLYSLDPGPLSLQPLHLKPEEDFYGYKNLGYLTLTDLKKRSAAVNVVTDHVRHADFRQIARASLINHFRKAH